MIIQGVFKMSYESLVSDTKLYIKENISWEHMFKDIFFSSVLTFRFTKKIWIV